MRSITAPQFIYIFKNPVSMQKLKKNWSTFYKTKIKSTSDLLVCMLYSCNFAILIFGIQCCFQYKGIRVGTPGLCFLYWKKSPKNSELFVSYYNTTRKKGFRIHFVIFCTWVFGRKKLWMFFGRVWSTKQTKIDVRQPPLISLHKSKLVQQKFIKTS